MKKYIQVFGWKLGILAAYLFGVNFFICPDEGRTTICDTQQYSNFFFLGVFTTISRLVELICYCMLSISHQETKVVLETRS